MEIKDNDIAAFPCTFDDMEDGKKVTYQFGGMTLRDHFAAKAMQAAMTDMKMDSILDTRTALAVVAYAVADAMLAERAK